MAADTKAEARPQGAAGPPKITWDDSEMQSTYANVCNVSSTREEVIVFFGTNQAWKGTEQEVTVGLTNRVILSPFAAKRLSLLLNAVINQYEGRFGTLDVTPQVPEPTTKN
jgi:hypothetical protein